MKSRSAGCAVVWLALVLLASCGKQEEARQTGTFDAKYIAAEADKGNLGPLKELNAACSAEVVTQGKRSGICGVQDEVGRLAKPLGVRF